MILLPLCGSLYHNLAAITDEQALCRVGDTLAAEIVDSTVALHAIGHSDYGRLIVHLHDVRELLSAIGGFIECFCASGDIEGKRIV